MSEAVSNYSSINGSDDLPLGVTGLIFYYETYLKNLKEHLKKTMDQVTPTYESTLRDRAVKKGWGPASNSISVSYDADNMEMSVTGDMYKEYGTGVEPPRSVIRSAITHVQDLEDMVNQDIQRRAF